MSTCRDRVSEILPEYVHGFLDPEETGRVKDHLEICPDCASEVQVLRHITDEISPDPAPWFFSSLPAKVTAEIEVSRKRKARMLVPVWVGGLATAVLAIVMLLLPGATPEFSTDVTEYAAVEMEGFFFNGLEDEILSTSRMFADDLDQAIGLDLDTVSGDVFITTQTILENDVYETMDDEAIRLFEALVEEMTPESIRKKVLS